MTPSAPRERIQFAPDEPVTVTLLHTHGRIVSGSHGEQVMWDLEADKAMVVGFDVAQKMNMLEPQPGESICLCKRCDRGSRQQEQWDVWLSPATIETRATRRNVSEGECDLMGQLAASLTAVNERRYGRRKLRDYHDELCRDA